MLKKKMISLVLSILVISTFSIFTGNTLAAGGGNEVTSVAACQDVSLLYYSKNTITKEVTFKVTGTPGNMISLHIYKYLGARLSSTYEYLPSSGGPTLKYRWALFDAYS